MIKTAQDLSKLKEQYLDMINKLDVVLLVCAGTGCVASGSYQVFEHLQAELEKRNLAVKLELTADGCQGVGAVKSGCHGFCEMGPLVRIEPAGLLYTKVKEKDVEDIVNGLVNKELVERLLYRHPITGERYAKQDEIPFYKHQKRVALANCGVIDPEDIYAYIAHDGYQGLAKALNSTPKDVVNEVFNSKLRGRGGGGFPTGRKWSIAAAVEADQKYIICNGDEGDPGAFMDRSVMEGDPHRIVEAMIIAGYAIGASEGYIYVRAEYPLAVQRLRKALKEAEKYGLLGKNILGSNFSFKLKIKEGAGAFVCGEESALIASIEGKRGMPTTRPPYPAVEGLWGKPTVINNVETLANIPDIIRQGAEWFSSVGTPESPGTKTFALTGEVANTGLIEVPSGITLREVVFDIGGGILQGKTFKAVQIGGPSGGCLTEEHLSLPLDFDSLQKVGAMIGSGGLVTMGEGTCMVEIARFFLSFTQKESCGKCTPCREGTKRMLEILNKITQGAGTLEDLDQLQYLARNIKLTSLCGLGQTAPNPVLSTLRYFYDEYRAHIEQKRCPAGVCSALLSYRVIADKCKGCTKCAKVCPVQAISGRVKEVHLIDSAICIKCDSCYQACRFGAISKGGGE